MSKNSLLMVLIFFLVFGLNVFAIRADPANESEFIAFLNENPNVIIFDFRWETVYSEGHLSGAFLINSSLTDEEKKAKVDSILQSENATFESPLAMYCNCETGGLSGHMEEYLNEEGYNNTISLDFSFSLWSNTTYLAFGSTRYDTSESTPGFAINAIFLACLIPLFLRIKKRNE